MPSQMWVSVFQNSTSKLLSEPQGLEFYKILACWTAEEKARSIWIRTFSPKYSYHSSTCPVDAVFWWTAIVLRWFMNTHFLWPLMPLNPNVRSCTDQHDLKNKSLWMPSAQLRQVYAGICATCTASGWRPNRPPQLCTVHQVLVSLPTIYSSHAFPISNRGVAQGMKKWATLWM